MDVNVSRLRFQNNRKGSDFDWISVILIILAIGIAIGSIIFIFYFRESKVDQLIQSKSPISLIIVENRGDKTESIFLGYYNPKTNKLAFISIPDRTRLKVDYEDKTKYDTIENIYFNGGISIVKKTIEKLTDSQFNYYLVYDLKFIEKIVDLLEGLELYNANNIDYFDADSRIYIKVPKGKVVLDGAKVKELLMYKYGKSGYKTLLENHRVVTESLLDRAQDIEKLFSNSKVMKQILKELYTDFSRKDLVVLASEIKKVNSSRLLFYKMFGKNIVIKDESFIAPIENGMWLRDRIKSVNKFINDEGPAPIKDEINIEILNGSTNAGQAQSLRNYFIEYEFNVVNYGNAVRNDYEKTVVIDRVGKPLLAKRIADIINCKEVYTRIDKTLLVDVTIIIGNNFEGKYVR